jgi:hypothetical protein
MIDQNSCYIGMPVVWTKSSSEVSGVVSDVWRSGFRVVWPSGSAWYYFDNVNSFTRAIAASIVVDIGKIRSDKLEVLGI